MSRRNVKEIVNAILSERASVTNREVAARAGVSRQAVHRHLRELVTEGMLVAEGAGRGARYRQAAPAPLAGAGHPLRIRYPLAGLDEDRVWKELLARVPGLEALPSLAADIAHFAFTEMLNNAIDHSRAGEVEVCLELLPARLRVEVADEGIGIFAHLKAALGLESELAALQELSKGKVTTQPERHTGEGIFFSSKAVDYFELESGELRWMVDNERADAALAPAPNRRGTRVHFEVNPATSRSLGSLFEEYSTDYQVTRTRVHIKLFTIGVKFVSRSEAKRLMHGLERFREVVLDFQGVETVGQGFADEVFRVWAGAHPNTRLEPIRMSPTVEFMVRRGLVGVKR